jgi:hypothetical protein
VLKFALNRFAASPLRTLCAGFPDKYFMTAISVTAYGIPTGALFNSPGRLGSPLDITSAGDTDHIVYTVPNDSNYAMVNLSITNREAVSVYSACVAISTSSTPADHEFVEWGTFIQPYGTMERTNLVMAANEKLIVRFPAQPIPVPPVIGQVAYTTAGTYSWTAPAGVTSVSVVAVGAGGSASVYYGAGGGGGALAYKNSISVVPGNTYTVVVGGAGSVPTTVNVTGGSGGASSFTAAFGTLTASGGAGGQGTPKNGGAGGAPTGVYDGGGSGGAGGSNLNAAASAYAGGGGGAGGYTGNGGAGGGGASINVNYDATAGSGGGGGGGAGRTINNAFEDLASGAGGGVGILGLGSDGAAGVTNSSTVLGGRGGSGGANGTTTSTTSARPVGGAYGGGGGSNGGSSSSPGTFNNGLVGAGAPGAIRIIWPGNARQFPSTRTADE